MDKKPTWWQRRKIEFGLGVKPAKWVDMTHLDPKNRTIIRFKDKFIELWEDENGDIQHYAWSKNHDMFPDSNLNDVWTASPEKR